MAAGNLRAALETGKLEEGARLIERAVEEKKLRAATLYVSRQSDSFARAYGEAKAEDAIFLIASITKPMAAAGVMRLVERGEMALPDPVHKYIPEL